MTNQPSSRAKTVLVVDDEVSILELLEILLEDNYKVITCNISTQALRKAQEQRPDLVILDLMMPGIKGTEVLEQLRHEPDLCDVPVILMSASSRFNDELVSTSQKKENKLSLVTKPFDNYKLLNLVDTMIHY